MRIFFLPLCIVHCFFTVFKLIGSRIVSAVILALVLCKSTVNQHHAQRIRQVVGKIPTESVKTLFG